MKPERTADVPSDWIKLDTREFSLHAPTGTSYEPLQGIDSFVGQFRNSAFVIEFDYGSYAPHTPDSIPGRTVRERFRIDGIDAVIYEEKNVGAISTIERCGTLVGLVTGIVQTIPPVPVTGGMAGEKILYPPFTLDMFACTASNTNAATIKRLYKSIRFHTTRPANG